jgi:PKD repeat protein
MEWVDSLGADVITSSLTYSDWYSLEDYDGQTATITIAANTATALGILVCNANGNSGPGASTMLPPADAFEILACGAVYSTGGIASFSSRGPTFDGRTKPEVCARGVSTACASTGSDNSYTAVSGTSLSTPLVAGAACLLIQARPNFPPQLIRQALMETADNATTPDNTYGWGIINLEAALNWGANFSADITEGEAPQTVEFTDLSTLSTPTWQWSFGDGDSSTVQNPTHAYTESGRYNVSLTIDTEYGPLTSEKANYIILLGDTLTFKSDSMLAGQSIAMSVELTNSQPLNKIVIPFAYGDTLLSLDSVTRGSRTSYFERKVFLTSDPGNKRYTVEMVADYGGGSPLLPKGSGEIMKIYFSSDYRAVGGVVDYVDSTNSIHSITLDSDILSYDPVFYPGTITTKYILRGDANYTMDINVADLSYIVDYLFRGGPFPVTLQAGDLNGDFLVNVDDITYMVEYLFKGGPPPPTP